MKPLVKIKTQTSVTRKTLEPLASVIGYAIAFDLNPRLNIVTATFAPDEPTQVDIEYEILSYANRPRITFDRDLPVTGIEQGPDAIAFARQIISASIAAKAAYDWVQTHLRLRKTDPSGSSDDRAEAIAKALESAGGDLENLHAAINAAITASIETDERSPQRQALDDIYNALVILDKSHLWSQTQKAAEDYVRARSAHISLSRAPADEYDEVAASAADRTRTSAHNAFIGAFVRACRTTTEAGCENLATMLANASDPYAQPVRESIAQMAYVMTNTPYVR